MSIYYDRTKQRWRFEFSRRINGQRVRIRTILPKGWSKAQRDRYEQTQSARYFAEATGVDSPRLTLAGAVKLYLDHRVPQLRNGKKCAQDLAHLIDHIERCDLRGVSALATKYDIDNRGKLAPGTIRNRLSYLRAAVRYAYRVHSYGDRNYADTMVLPAANNDRQIYAKLPELSALWKAFRCPQARALFKAAFYMGLRWRAELLPRTPADIIKNDGQTWLVIGKTKNGLPVMKPVHPAAIPCLKMLPFTWKDSYFYYRWREAVAAIGRPELRPHDLRHSLASEIRARGGTLEDVQGALHQVSRQSAQRYAHLYPEKLKSIMLGVGGQKFTPQRGNKAEMKRRKRAVSA